MVLDPAWGDSFLETLELELGGRWRGQCEAGAEGSRLRESMCEGPEARAPSRGWSLGSPYALKSWFWAASCLGPSWLMGSPAPGWRKRRPPLATLMKTAPWPR